MTEKNNLNLARKWRPQSFDHVVGQDLAIKMLSNSLKLNKLFPVYLFSGQRGCGKTSTARIFAAAVNCKQLTSFQQEISQISVPCLTCSSCTAMIKGDHPDFIEIDAASHTGVDNVRQIIDAASYMPLIGRKKVYLIDEAHMLSKAAFNACLKILEEPPTTALFILATTEVPKIPATIVSRCFQLIFNPIDTIRLKNHLRSICTNESITIDEAALDIIIDETDGSARDAINLLERMRFSGNLITEQHVLDTLGKISMQDLFKLLSCIIEQKAPDLLNHLRSINFEQRAPHLLWDMIIHVCRALVWTKYGISQIPGNFGRHPEELGKLAQSCSLNRLTAMFNFLWSQEEIFLKTTQKHLCLEMILIQLCQQVDVLDLQDLIKMCNEKPLPPYQQPPVTTVIPIVQETSPQLPPSATPQPTLSPQPVPPQAVTEQKTSPQTVGWGGFLQEITHLNDPLLCSIFAQATFIGNDEPNKKIKIQLSSDSAFFKNKITETTSQWLPLFKRCFAGYEGFLFESAPPKPQSAAPQPLPIRPATAPIPDRTASSMRTVRQEDDALVIRDAAQWPKASLILRYFPGKIRKIKQVTNESTT
jgi:DNA polymerase-3 subunit gamma/tau